MQKKLSLTTILTVLLALNGFCQLQRLAILPQSNIKISNYQPANLKTICIDYFREIPSVTNTKSQPYNQVYTNENVIVKINGVQAKRSFQSLVQSENPLLFLQPTSHHTVEVSINPLHPESTQIKSIELEFKSSSEIGNIKDDRDVSQSELIFQTWGAEISQEDFWKRAKCLDIIAKNNKLSLNDNRLSETTKKICDDLLARIDLNIFPEKVFKTLVENSFFNIDEKANLTQESIKNLEQAYYYYFAINDAKRLNSYSSVNIKKLKEKSDEVLKRQSLLSALNTGTVSEITEDMIMECLEYQFQGQILQAIHETY